MASPIGLGLVVEDNFSELSCIKTQMSIHQLSNSLLFRSEDTSYEGPRCSKENQKENSNNSYERKNSMTSSIDRKQIVCDNEGVGRGS